MRLHSMLDSINLFVHNALIGSSRELPPMFDLRDAENNSTIVVTPFIGETDEEVNRNKDFTAFLVRKKIIEHKITHYLYLSEGWAIIRNRDQYKPGISTTPSNSADRIEVVISFATDGATYLSSSWEIKRNGPVCIALIPREIKLERPPDTHKGRFDNLLRTDDKHPS
jgi:hypothetical protein